MSGMLLLATAAMAGATFLGVPTGALVPLVASFFVFEACVGTYFPLIGTLRSKYLPDAYRGVIMNLFGIPLNLIGKHSQRITLTQTHPTQPHR